VGPLGGQKIDRIAVEPASQQSKGRIRDGLVVFLDASDLLRTNRLAKSGCGEAGLAQSDD
jgi:hypothetical protein